MTNSTVRNLGLGMMLTFAFSRMAIAKETSANRTITLRVYNNATVPDKTWMEAEREVTRIFAKLRVKATWAGALTVQADAPYDFSLAVIILNRSAAALLPRSKTAMGHTPQGEDIKQGRVTYIFYDRVEDFTHTFQQRSVATDNVHTLAYTIAHEIGHLLLPSEPHSLTGIMRCSWELDDFKHMINGELSFGPQWGELIKDAVLRRSQEIAQTMTGGQELRKKIG